MVERQIGSTDVKQHLRVRLGDIALQPFALPGEDAIAVAALFLHAHDSVAYLLVDRAGQRMGFFSCPGVLRLFVGTGNAATAGCWLRAGTQDDLGHRVLAMREMLDDVAVAASQDRLKGKARQHRSACTRSLPRSYRFVPRFPRRPARPCRVLTYWLRPSSPENVSPSQDGYSIPEFYFHRGEKQSL